MLGKQNEESNVNTMNQMWRRKNGNHEVSRSMGIRFLIPGW